MNKRFYSLNFIGKLLHVPHEEVVEIMAYVQNKMHLR